jgi:hypothetical protein
VEGKERRKRERTLACCLGVMPMEMAGITVVVPGTTAVVGICCSPPAAEWGFPTFIYRIVRSDGVEGGTLTCLPANSKLFIAWAASAAAGVSYSMKQNPLLFPGSNQQGETHSKWQREVRSGCTCHRSSDLSWAHGTCR